jgi:hypothetical protein
MSVVDALCSQATLDGFQPQVMRVVGTARRAAVGIKE